MIKQLVSAVISLNYGEETEIPTVTPEIKQPQDQLADAQRNLELFGKLGLPVAEKFLYQRHGVPQPKPGEELFVPLKANPFLKSELAGSGKELSLT